MSDFGSCIDRSATAESSLLRNNSPRVLITGACSGVGHACAEALAAGGIELILCDKDVSGLSDVAEALGAVSRFCDVASEASVANLAAEVLEQFASLDMVVNAAGGGYERTLGMYRVSRALVTALRHGTHKVVLNVPPSPADADAAIFPYASSRLAFQRLSSALAFETRGMSVTVLIGCPTTGRVTDVRPDPNAGTWAETCNVGRPNREDVLTLARQVASLVDRNAVSKCHAG